MSKVTWGDIAKGDRVELMGKPWTVEKAKRKGDYVKVTVTDGRRVAGPTMLKVRTKVKRLKPEPLHDKSGAQRRWAEPAEAEPKRKGLAPGNPDDVAQRTGLSADVWNAPRDGAEKMLDAILGARLVGEGDESQGYYVPPVDVSTIASHMVIFHPNTYDPAKDEATMLAGHAHEHKMVLDGTAFFDVNHWHTETRPKVAR